MPKLTLTPAGKAQPTLRAIRKDLGLNLREASERIGCSISALSKVERSVRSFSFFYAVAVSRAYSIPLDTLALMLYPSQEKAPWTPGFKFRWRRPAAPSVEGLTASINAPDGVCVHNPQLQAYLQIPSFLKGT